MTKMAKRRGNNLCYVKSKDTSIELRLQKALWAKGYRYRKNFKTLPGKPDIVLPKYRIAIFCDGEFFHGKDWSELKKQLERGNNSEYWVEKIERNIERDREQDQQLVALGWSVIRFWGKEIEENIEECIKAIEERIFDMGIVEEELMGSIPTEMTGGELEEKHMILSAEEEENA